MRHMEQNTRREISGFSSFDLPFSPATLLPGHRTYKGASSVLEAWNFRTFFEG